MTIDYQELAGRIERGEIKVLSINGDATTLYGQAYQAACRVVARAIRGDVGGPKDV